MTSLAKQILEKCTSFELRGPKAASLIEVDGVNLIVQRQETDWSSLSGDRSIPIIDNRTDRLTDLMPRPRDVLHQMLQSVTSSVGVKPKTPGMR